MVIYAVAFNNRSLLNVTTGKLQEGARLLVIGASGGCGLACLQVIYSFISSPLINYLLKKLASAMKAGQIVGVCSAKNDSIVRQHGATEVMDYNRVNTYYLYLLCVFYYQHDISTYFENDKDKFDMVIAYSLHWVGLVTMAASLLLE